jgi:putative glycosyltransferase
VSQRTELSIVTTLYRSAAMIEEFVRRATAAAEAITSSFEIIIVDDGSPDNSLEIAVRLAADDPRIKVVELSRNFGHHRALMTGLAHASGARCFMIDSDLEEAPELLGEFWDRMAKGGMDVVYGYQLERAGSVGRRLSGEVAYWLFRVLIPYEIPRNHITVRLMQRSYVEALLLHKERMTAIGGLWVITGFRQIGLPVNKGSRDDTTYSLRKRWHALIDSIVSFSEVPLIGIFYLGMLISVLAAIATVSLVTMHMLGISRLAGWASVMLSIWLIGGVLIFCVGIIGIYISKIFIETKQRPYTIVRMRYGFDEHVQHRGGE